MFVNRVHLATITEFWLTDEIEDDQISIGRYVIHRKDRTHACGGGMCAHVSINAITQNLEAEYLYLECIGVGLWSITNEWFSGLGFSSSLD